MKCEKCDYGKLEGRYIYCQNVMLFGGNGRVGANRKPVTGMGYVENCPQYKRGTPLNMEKTMKILVPSDIEKEFLNLLDIAQSSITKEDEKHLTKKEKKCLAFVRKLIPDPSRAYANVAERVKAAREFAAIIHMR